jgi:hypothetical protein
MQKVTIVAHLDKSMAKGGFGGEPRVDWELWGLLYMVPDGHDLKQQLSMFEVWIEMLREATVQVGIISAKP